MSEYEQQAQQFLKDTGAELRIAFHRNGKHFEDDKSTRDIYDITLIRGNRVYNFYFGQSLNKSIKYQEKHGAKRVYHCDGSSAGSHKYRYLYPEKFPKDEKEAKFSEWVIIPREAPTAYDILACLTKYDPGTFEDFCSEFGYDTDSRKADRVYKAVKDEWDNVCKLFSDQEIERLAEIQ